LGGWPDFWMEEDEQKAKRDGAAWKIDPKTLL
jgi:hypothetical protein